MKKINQLKIAQLREKYPKFIYEKYSFKIAGNNLEIVFYFKVEPNIFFKPKIIVKNINKKRLAQIEEKTINNLIFHLGLIEIPSYWKATCSPIIEIKAGFLNKEQVDWWKDLILKGMGQFFYENKINWKKRDFLFFQIENHCLDKFKTESNHRLLEEKTLVPLGGGKDSIVTLEKLKEQGKEIGCFLVNPTKTMKEIVGVAKINDLVVIERKIDPALLQLNKKGFLNGHTPITAVLSFLSVFSALLFGYKNIAFSNEKSANEGNVKYLGEIINHQWSKSSEFEKKFCFYCKKYLAKNINYFSYLRKYTELEISKMFVSYPQYFSVFSSCNVVLAKKMNKKWCGNCPKCLFVYLILYPFLEKEKLLKIFGNDLFENRNLLSIMKGLVGSKEIKPFECVGTKKESQKAFLMSLKKAEKEGKTPFLLKKVKIIEILKKNKKRLR